MTHEQRIAILERLGRTGLAICESKMFESMYEAAGHFDYVINDLGFEASRLLGDGPYYVICVDSLSRPLPGVLEA